MITQFQKTLSKDTETLWSIIKVYHPELPEILKEKVSAYLHYDWVCIGFRVKDYGYIAIGIENCCQYKLFGKGISKAMMADALQNGTVSFRTWRFSDDFLYNKDINHYLSEEYKLIEENENQLTTEILRSAGYKLQTPEEMYHIYYAD